MASQDAVRPAGSTAGHSHDHHHDHDHGRTLAQWYCYIVGAVLLLAGLLGFFADATFDTAASGDATAGAGNANGQLQGDGFLGFEVNGWHNVVHLLSGAVLLALASRRGGAKLGAIAFGVIYGIVTVIGLIDGNDVLGIIPVNPADNVLHIVLSALGLFTGLRSRGDDHDHGHDHDHDTSSRVSQASPAAAGRSGNGHEAGAKLTERQVKRPDGPTGVEEGRRVIAPADGDGVERPERPRS